MKPKYYNDSKITPLDVIDDWGLDFRLGNAIKYIKRAGHKDGNSVEQDLNKAIEYLKLELEHIKSHDESPLKPVLTQVYSIYDLPILKSTPTTHHLTKEEFLAKFGGYHD